MRLLIPVLLIVGSTVAGVCACLLTACGPDKPVIQPNPEFVKCENAKDNRENDCLSDAGTRADFDDCIARVRKTCVDGGK